MNKIIALLLIALVLATGCTTNAPPAQNGTLEGHITIGPICPVETNPPNPDCEPSEQTYAAYKIGVFSVTGEKITEFNGDRYGNYKVELPEGRYRLNQLGGLLKYSAEIEIVANETRRVDIDIDTGIR